MRVSNLIKKLEQLKNEHEDSEVYIIDISSNQTVRIDDVYYNDYCKEIIIE